ncbi:MAG: hypothetical protein KDK59_00730 [Simkania sp.]|nr:hypothetical protein [Simkania sp.]
MSGRIFLGLLSGGSAVRTQHGLNLWGRLNHRSYSTALKLEGTKSEKMDNFLPFKDFKDKYVESWENFKESPLAKTVYGNDLEKISRAYERFCLSQYSQYKHQAYGGNPSLMT